MERGEGEHLAAGTCDRPRIAVTLPYAERAARALIESHGTEDRSLPHAFLARPTSRAADCWSNLLKGLRRVVDVLPSRSLRLWAMHATKMWTADVVYRQRFEAEIVVGFPGASMALFSANADALKVLHSVDAHPRAHNAALSQLPKQRRRAELYPEWLARRIEGELAEADVVLVPSNTVAEQMRDGGVPASKLLVVPYGADTARFSAAESEGLEAGSEGVPEVLYVGQISQRKNVRTLIEAARDLPLRLVLAGRVFDKSIVENLPTNVVLAGVLDRNALARMYRRADAFAIASLEDACSLVVLEAAVTGLPILLTAENGAHEVLPASAKTLLSATSVRDWSNALREVPKLPMAERYSRAADARRAVDDWSSYAERVRGQLCDRSAGRVP